MTTLLKYFKSFVWIFLFLSLALPTFPTFGESQAHLKSLTLMTDWYINPDHAPLLVGITKGYFKQAGINLILISPSDSTSSVKLLADNKVDMIIDYQPQLIQAISKKLPIQFAGNLIPQPLSCLTVLDSPGIQTLKDLDHKKIGGSISGFSGSTTLTMLKNAGVDTQTITFIAVGMNLSQALLSHQVDAVYGMSRNVEPVQLAILGIKTRLFYPENYGIPSYSELVFAVNKNTADPSEIKAFMSALSKSVLDLQAHPEEDWKLVSESNEFHNQLAETPEIAKENHAIWLKTIPYFTAYPTMQNIKLYNQYIRFAEQEKLLNQEIPIQEYEYESQ